MFLTEKKVSDSNFYVSKNPPPQELSAGVLGTRGGGLLRFEVMFKVEVPELFLEFVGHMLKIIIVGEIVEVRGEVRGEVVFSFLLLEGESGCGSGKGKICEYLSHFFVVVEALGMLAFLF